MIALACGLNSNVPSILMRLTCQTCASKTGSVGHAHKLRVHTTNKYHRKNLENIVHILPILLHICVKS